MKPSNKKPYSKPNTRGKDGEVRVSKNKWNNDPKWHILNPETLKDLGRINLLHPLGQNIRISSPAPTAAQPGYSEPGLMVFYWYPGCGSSVNGASGVNLAANQLYQVIRHEFSGSSSYVAPDLFMYIMAMDSIHIFYRKLVRAYGVLKQFSALNRYKPKAYFKAMNLDWESFSRDPAGFKSWLDVMVHKINQRSVPKTIDLLNYHNYVMEKIWKDHDSAKAQEYIFEPAYVYQYEGYTDRAGGKLVAKWLQPHHTYDVSPMTLSAAQGLLEDMVNAVITDEDSGIMMTDMLKAFGAENMLAAPLITVDYTTPVEYNYDELMSIHNMTLVGYPFDMIPQIRQDSQEGATEGGKIICSSEFVARSAYGTARKGARSIFNTDKVQPTETDMAEWLRFHNGIADLVTATTVPFEAAVLWAKSTYTELTSVVCGYAGIITYNSFGDSIHNWRLESSVISTSDPAFLNILHLNQFDWAPIVYVVMSTINEQGISAGAEVSPIPVTHVLADLDQFGLLDTAYLNPYKSASNLAELNVRA